MQWDDLCPNRYENTLTNFTDLERECLSEKHWLYASRAVRFQAH